MKNWLYVALVCVVVGCSGKTDSLVLPELSRTIVVEKGSQKTIDAIKKASNVDVPDERGATPLMYAAGLHVTDSVRDTRKDSGPENIDILKALVEKGANVNAVTKDGQTTALKVLVFHGKAQSIRFLLEHGAKPDLTGGGMTPLMLASYRCYPDIVEALLKAGADKGIKDSAGSTALDHAKSKECAAAVTMLSARPQSASTPKAQ